MPFLSRDGIQFNYRVVGDDDASSLPFVFLHGLGGEISQPLGFITPPPTGVRVISMDARGHGETRPVGDESKLKISTLADDVISLLDHLKIDRAVVGGISMGAALSMNIAVRHPSRVLGLVLSRPAWLDRTNPENLRTVPLIARLIRDFGPKEGAERFKKTPEYAQMLRDAAECAATLVNQFSGPRAVDAVARLERIPHDAPIRSLRDLESIRVPTLMLACHADTLHPWEFGVEVSKRIPGARFAELTSKSVSVELHAADTRREIEAFLHKHFLKKDSSR